MKSTAQQARRSRRARRRPVYFLETFSSLDLLLCRSRRAIRSFSALPIVAQATFSEEGTTIEGTRTGEAAARLAAQNVQAIGANCTLGPQSLLGILEGLGGAGKPLSAMPNVGFPKRVGDRIVYPRSSPEYFSLFARDAVAMGARIIGGCCGTTPEHIRAVAESGEEVAAYAEANQNRGASAKVRVRSEVARRSSERPKREPESTVSGGSCRRRSLRFRSKSTRPRAFPSSAFSSRWTR